MEFRFKEGIKDKFVEEFKGQNIRIFTSRKS